MIQLVPPEHPAVCLRLKTTDVESEFLKCIYEDTKPLRSLRKHNLPKKEEHEKTTF